jgi:UDP-N-acetylmuramate dehydrogenase
MPAIKSNIPLAPYTTFKIGGPARYFTTPESMEEYRQCMLWAVKRGLPFFILGGGANILVSDNGYRGLVIHTKKLRGVRIEGTTIIAECGVMIDHLVDMSLKHGLSGIEFAAGLPGSVGGALYMNAQAHDVAFSSIVEETRIFHLKGKELEEKVLTRKELESSYKRSVFQKEYYFVSKTVLGLKKSSQATILSKIEKNRALRKIKGQFRYPNAGSIFKNDRTLGKPSGMIIDELGLKGTRIGNAEVFQEHANFIVNLGGATATDVYRLIRLIEDEAYKKRGIKLEREVLLVGDWEEE